MNSFSQKLENNDLIDTIYATSTFFKEFEQKPKGVLVIPCQITSINPKFITYNTLDGNGFTIEVGRVYDKSVNGRPFVQYDLPKTDFSNIRFAGEELQKASDRFYTGFAVMLIGAGISSIGVALPYKNNGEDNMSTKRAFIYTGAGIATIGFCINISSWSKVSRAGKNLQHYKDTFSPNPPTNILFKR